MTPYQGTFGCLFLCLSACSVINYSHKPSDFPELEKHEHEVDVTQFCYAGQVSCSWIIFPINRCDIYVPPGKFGLKHEKAHCNGYDHYMDSSIADAWNQWKPKKRGETVTLERP